MSRENHMCKSSELGISRIFFKAYLTNYLEFMLKYKEKLLKSFFKSIRETLILFKF